MVYLGADHAGFGIKREIVRFFDACRIPYQDLGASVYDQTDDYPPYAVLVAKAVVAHPGSLGILICGTGTGMVIVANKIKGAKAAFGFSEYAAKMARQDNGANILTFSGRKQAASEAIHMVKVFLETSPSEEERHKRRLKEIAQLEENFFESHE